VTYVRKAIVTLLFLLALNCSVVAQDLSQTDLQAVRAAAAAYAHAWLTNDADAVMATFVAEPVLSPSGLKFLDGQKAARAFWFPVDSPPTNVTVFDLNELEAGGSGDLAYVRGTFELSFVYDGSQYLNSGKYVFLLSKMPDGAWLISHHIWDDYPRTE
jgi:ketosteroid isomerase-like protein